MAVENRVRDEARFAAVDLTGKRFYGVKLNGTGGVVLATAGAVYAVLVDEATSGRAVPIRRTGTAKCILGGTVAEGDRLTTDANGKFVKLTPGTPGTYPMSMGQAREGGILNDVISVDVEVPVPTPSA